MEQNNEQEFSVLYFCTLWKGGRRLHPNYGISECFQVLSGVSTSAISNPSFRMSVDLSQFFNLMAVFFYLRDKVQQFQFGETTNQPTDTLNSLRPWKDTDMKTSQSIWSILNFILKMTLFQPFPKYYKQEFSHIFFFHCTMEFLLLSFLQLHSI